jgi:hypothetical protein
MNRRHFLTLSLGAIITAIPAISAGVTVEDKLDRICSRIGEWSRKQNVHIQRIIMTDKSGRLVLDGRRSQSGHESNRNMYLLSDGTFHLADRSTEHYTKIVYCVEPRWLNRARELFAVIHVVGEEKPYTFELLQDTNGFAR